MNSSPRPPPDSRAAEEGAIRVPAGQADLEPKLNSIQTLIAAKHAGQWRIILFQNTLAQFHGRPELVQELTAELRQLR